MALFEFIIALISFLGAKAIARYDKRNYRYHWEEFFILIVVGLISTLVWVLDFL